MRKKSFKYGDRVRIEAHGKTRGRHVLGTVYDQEKLQKAERLIYVQVDNGCGIAFLVRFVNHI